MHQIRLLLNDVCACKVLKYQKGSYVFNIT
uniref:Uncharacterized protein n=1 Tax=Anguilla anguilla TaxID=7936 RepID=A0A0E9TK80_ANGAN